MADATRDSARLSGFRLSPELIAIVTMGLMLGAGMFNLSGRIESLRIEMRAEFQALRKEINGRFGQRRTETNGQFSQQRAETNGRFGEVNRQFDQLRAEMNGLRAEMNDKFAQARAETNGQFGQQRAEMDARFGQMNGQFDQVRAEIRGLRAEVRADRLALSSADQALRKETSDRFLSVESQLQILQSALIRPPASPSSEEDTEPGAQPAPGAE